MALGGGGGDLAGSRLRKHSITIAGHRTSLSLEDAFFELTDQPGPVPDLLRATEAAPQ